MDFDLDCWVLLVNPVLISCSRVPTCLAVQDDRLDGAQADGRVEPAIAGRVELGDVLWALGLLSVSRFHVFPSIEYAGRHRLLAAAVGNRQGVNE